MGRWATSRSLRANRRSIPARSVYSVAGPARCVSDARRACLRSPAPMAPLNAKEEPWSSPRRETPVHPALLELGKSAPEAVRSGSPIRSRGLRDRCGLACLHIARVLDLGSDESDPPAGAGAHGRARRSARSNGVRDSLQDVVGTGREEARGQSPERGRAPCPSRCRIRPLDCSILRPRRSDRRQRSPRSRTSRRTKRRRRETTTERVLHRLHGRRPRLVPKLRQGGFRRALGCQGDRGNRHRRERGHGPELGCVG